ncbi:MAG: hypothetical protein ACHQK9_17865 [Reyranellales bacterium]
MICHAVIVLMWAFALWHAWECRGLYLDGASYLIGILLAQSFLGLDLSRAHSGAVVQVPVVAALWAGVSDLHWLTRVWSFGLFGVPTALYTLALLRARTDTVLLAATVASVALVFMTTSFFIVGEYNTAHATAIAAAVWLAATDRLGVAGGIVLVALATLALGTYETFVLLGPLLALMTAWTIWRAPAWPALATALYWEAAVLFLAATAAQAHSLIFYDDPAYLAWVISRRWQFVTNRQLCLVIAAALIVFAWGFVRPADLGRTRPYLWAGLPLVLAALTPILVILNMRVSPPYAITQQDARIAGGGVAAAVIVFMWAYRSRLAARLPAITALGTPETARRLLAFTCLMLAALLPWDILMTHLYSRYLGEVRTSIRSQSGLIDIDNSTLPRHPRLWQGENWTFPSLSLILRSGPSDGLIAPPKGFQEEGLYPNLAPARSRPIRLAGLTGWSPCPIEHNLHRIRHPPQSGPGDLPWLSSRC